MEKHNPITGEPHLGHTLDDASYSKKLMITTTDKEKELIRGVLEAAR